MADTFTFELVSPERLLLSVQAASVLMPGAEGDLGILPGHAPLITSLRPGVIEVSSAEGDPANTRIFVDGGIAEVARDQLVVLAEEAIAVADLDRAELEQRIQNTREDIEDAADAAKRRRAEEKLQHLEALLSAAD